MLCPGKKQFVSKAKDLDPSVFRRLVDRRARRLIDPTLAPSETEEARRALEIQLEKVHLEPNFLPARFLEEGAARAEAVCRIRTGTSLGTGFLIGRGILMTNNHVIGDRNEAAGSVAEFGFEAGETARVAAIQPSRLFITDEALDFTIVACDDSPVGNVEPIRLLRSPATVTRNERVNIIQHPSGRPKEVTLHENVVTRILQQVIRYETDTEPGSSGSPVFNNDWELVGLHHAGVPRSGGRAENEGIRIAAIVAHLLGQSRESLRAHEALRPVIEGITDTSPYLGFFDTAGVADPKGQEVQVADFQGSPDFADIGVWNIEHFNDRVPDARVSNVADVAERLSLDILGLVEVQDDAMRRLVGELGGRGWAVDYRLSDVPGSQDLAVLFDAETSNVKLLPELAAKHHDRLSAKTAGGKTVFPRHPLFAECTVAADNDQEVKFVLIVVHLKAFGDAESRARRRLAAEALGEIVEDVRQDTDLPVVLGGDFNERIDTDVLGALTGSPDLLAMTADDATTDAVSYVGGSRRSLIDHIVVSSDVRLGEISGDDTAIVRLDRSVRDFADRVSDHLPLVFRMVYRAQPVDIEPVEPDAAHRLAIPDGATALEVSFEAP